MAHAMNHAKSSLIVVNGEQNNPRLRKLSNRVKPRQTLFPKSSSEFAEIRAIRVKAFASKPNESP